MRSAAGPTSTRKVAGSVKNHGDRHQRRHAPGSFFERQQRVITNRRRHHPERLDERGDNRIECVSAVTTVCMPLIGTRVASAASAASRSGETLKSAEVVTNSPASAGWLKRNSLAARSRAVSKERPAQRKSQGGPTHPAGQARSGASDTTPACEVQHRAGRRQPGRPIRRTPMEDRNPAEEPVENRPGSSPESQYSAKRRSSATGSSSPETSTMSRPGIAPD